MALFSFLGASSCSLFGWIEESASWLVSLAVYFYEVVVFHFSPLFFENQKGFSMMVAEKKSTFYKPDKVIERLRRLGV